MVPVGISVHLPRCGPGDDATNFPFFLLRYLKLLMIQTLITQDATSIPLVSQFSTVGFSKTKATGSTTVAAEYLYICSGEHSSTLSKTVNPTYKIFWPISDFSLTDGENNTPHGCILWNKSLKQTGFHSDFRNLTTGFNPILPFLGWLETKCFSTNRYPSMLSSGFWVTSILILTYFRISCRYDCAVQRLD